ncbi:MAG: hypothetical protein HYY06_04900 [Deltaproteobacteria bacterium]|nr:hypothetical protein [Deltaproteobacteria bacterium]
MGRWRVSEVPACLGIAVVAWLGVPAAARGQHGAGDGQAPAARVPAYVAASPPCTPAATVAVTAEALRPMLRAAAGGEVPQASASELVSSCAVSRGEIVDALNRGGLRAHRARDYARAVRMWELAVEVDPSKTAARYNLACGYAMTGRRDEAIAQLAQLRCAGEAGARWLVRAQEDGDLATLRADPRFVSALRPVAPAPAPPAPAPAPAAPAFDPICREIEDPDEIRQCVVRPGGRALPGGGRVDIAEVTNTSYETTAYLVFRDADDIIRSEHLATSRDEPGESSSFRLGELSVTPTVVSVSVTDETVTTGNTGDPDEDAQIVTERATSSMVCTLRDDLYECESRVTNRTCQGSAGAPRWYVRSICGR